MGEWNQQNEKEWEPLEDRVSEVPPPTGPEVEEVEHFILKPPRWYWKPFRNPDGSKDYELTDEPIDIDELYSELLRNGCSRNKD